MTDKSAAAIRELAKRIYGMMNPAFVADRKKDLDGIVNLLTALISEHYVAKEEVEKMVSERLLNFIHWLRYRNFTDDTTTDEDWLSLYHNDPDIPE